MTLILRVNPRYGLLFCTGGAANAAVLLPKRSGYLYASGMRSLPYNLEALLRETKRHYISASEQELQAMLKSIGLQRLEDLYRHIPQNFLFQRELNIPQELNYEELLKHVIELASKNKPKTSFLGDGLPQYKTCEIVPYVLGIRKLTTAYTPYQPERSQGTLTSHWIYQCSLAAITGFEAINSSFYDRATAIFEAIKCAQRLVANASTAIVCDSIYPGDKEVILTLAQDTGLNIIFAPIDGTRGTTNLQKLNQLIESCKSQLAAIVFPQVNALGNLEEVDELTDLAFANKVKSIAVIDPMLLASGGGLKAPLHFGQYGADLFAAEGQHLAIPPNFGGPGLGIFGIRHTEKNKNDIRQTAGRFIGKAKDLQGRDCFSMVLSTREQHIRREKATSNICTNQAFLATLVGAALLERGAEGLHESALAAYQNAHSAVKELTNYPGVKLAFPNTAFFSEFVLKLPIPAKQLIIEASKAGLHIGVDVSERIENNNGEFLLLSFSDLQSLEDLHKLFGFWSKHFGMKVGEGNAGVAIPAKFLRQDKLELPKITVDELKKFYYELGEQNVSPDDNIYALGSCTMKYNPYINDFAASLPGFANLHPQMPIEDAQGALEVIYATQEYFKAICGLAAVTTQPVAGAQGELVGLKLFQAYHRDHGEQHRKIILTPRSAHGTNPATAAMAGLEVVIIEADQSGQIDMTHLKTLVEKYNNTICGVMVTNPNTSGIMETNFKTMADIIHAVGGLVYMDGANMNAIAGWVNLGAIGVDAVHNNTHKTWSIPHGGGGPGDAFVAVSEKLVDYLPGIQVVKQENQFILRKAKKSIGSVHRHFGNFGHKVRCYTYLRALGREGVKRMSAVSVLSARYIQQKLMKHYPVLPPGTENIPRMHEFILTLDKEGFSKVEAQGIPKALVIPRIGKLFLDFGLHAPTVAFPEAFGLMIEPTESFTKMELDRFVDIVTCIHKIIYEHPEVLTTVPHFTPVDRINEVEANKNLALSETLTGLPKIQSNRIAADKINKMSMQDIFKNLLHAHNANKNSNI